LALAFEQLKERLKAKGYFDRQRKKPIPKHIKKIVLVTAKESAALHDMLKIIEKRWSLLDVIIVDTLVQGDAAALQIARSLKYADSLSADVVVVGRGGGSVEDLWVFNEEAVADAIFFMHTPVVSAVGHEVDVLISDYVADLRAPTPSAAMEMILPDVQEILYTLDEVVQRYSHATKHTLQQSEQSLKHIEEMLLRSSPVRRVLEFQNAFSRLEDEFQRVMYYKMESFETRLPMLKKSFHQNIAFILQKKEQQLDHLIKKTEMSDPRSQCKKGWAQISVKGEPVPLCAVQENEHFTLEDASVKIEAICLSKENY